MIPLLLWVSLTILLGGCSQQSEAGEKQTSASYNATELLASTVIPNKPAEVPAVMYRSTDLGKTWSPFAEGIPKDATLSGIKQAGNNIYVTTDYHGIFLSTEGENNWQQLTSASLAKLDINCIEVEGEKLVIGTLNNGILFSEDGGLTWHPAHMEGEVASIRAFITSGGKLLAGTDAGIYHSNDMGKTWSHAYGKLQVLGFTSLGQKLYAATQNGALVNGGGLTKWKSIYEGDALHDIGNDGTYIYAMTIGQQLLKTADNGETWQNAQNGIVRPANYYTNELIHVEGDIFSAQWIGIYHSSDHGTNWRKLSGLPDSTAFSTLEATDYGILAGISIR
ncbi:MAG: hypothetical protein AAGI38_05575 [Bacteroidota bacterium]